MTMEDLASLVAALRHEKQLLDDVIDWNVGILRAQLAETGQKAKTLRNADGSGMHIQVYDGATFLCTITLPRRAHRPDRSRGSADARLSRRSPAHRITSINMFRQHYDALLRRRSQLDRKLSHIRKQMEVAPAAVAQREVRRVALALELTSACEVGVIDEALGRIANAEARAIVANLVAAS